MTKSRPRRLANATCALPRVSSDCLSAGSATDCLAYGVANYDVAISERFFQRAHGEIAPDFSERHRGACPQLSILAPAKKFFCVENIGEHWNPFVSTQRPVRIEESHFLRERAFTQCFRFQIGFDGAQ